MSHSSDDYAGWHGTTIFSVRKGGKVVMAGMGRSVLALLLLSQARKYVHYKMEKLFVVSLGSTADALLCLKD